MFPANKPVKVFYSYSHEDEALRKELEKQLAILKRENVISSWHDSEIEAGSDWDEEIRAQLDSADIILLLISADFLASDYAYEIEAREAMRRHEAGKARVIPIILRAADWTSAPFGKLQALPRGARPVTSWLNRDEAFADIAKGIRAVVERKARIAEPVDEEGGSQPDVEGNIPRLLPYLCNRSEQEEELTKALRHHQATMPRRPFVCVIHGDEFECHSDFVYRMSYTAIPHALNLMTKQVSLEEYQFEWPSPNVPPKRYAEIFAGNLGKALLQNSAAPPPEVIKYIAIHERPVLLVSHVLTEDFLHSGTDLFSQFLSFWNTWPELPPGRTVINCVCVKHQRLTRMGFLQRFRLKRLHARLFDYINELDFSSYGALSGVRLTELKAIRRSDVEAWSRIKEVRRRCHIQEKDIRALYEQAELVSDDGSISMEPLADQLRTLMSKNQHQKD